MLSKKIILFLLFLVTLSSCKNQVALNSDFSPPFNNFSKKVKHFSDPELREIYTRPSHQWPKAELDAGVEFRELGLLSPVKYPTDNPFSSAKVELGKILFFDKRLSGSGQISCSTCHDPQKGWSDGLETSVGNQGKQLKRNAPTIINSAHNPFQFWDGRVKTLEAQAEAVLLNPDEMHTTPAELTAKLQQIPDYQKRFKQVFAKDQVIFTDTLKALATFERTVVTKNRSPFDRFLNGESQALSASALRGLHLFRTEARCLNCHSGPEFTDNRFHNLSLTYQGTEMEDLGRFNITKNPNDWGVFKTPSLRNVVKTAPYMHNGVFLNLNKVLKQYNQGMHGGDPNKSPLIKAINLPEDQLDDLQAFLEALTEEISVRK